MTQLPFIGPGLESSDPTTSRTLIDTLLAEQGELTAVEKFSRGNHDQNVRHGRYRDLLPANGPAVGQQYAFEVNLDNCSGCKACVSACHSLNGLDDQETWREVGLLVGDPAEDLRARRGAAAFQQHVTTACHHCVDPACLNGCPVLAYDKDALTGIVRHLDDQCIGCQYCVMMCPYEVPQYSRTRGIVRKCDMCSSRLAAGEAPACAQACPTSAIRITVVDQSRVRGKYRRLSEFNFQPATADLPKENSFLPASPSPAISLPTTRFVTSRPLPEHLFAGDHSVLRRSAPHWPLVALLVFSQLAVGASVGALFVKNPRFLLLASPAMAIAAMAAGILHLGQPLKAWRSFLGWRKSWFSREVIAMGLFVLLLSAAGWSERLRPWLMPAAGLAGLATVMCSIMIYADTQREFWNLARTLQKFMGTTILLGATATLVSLALSGSSAKLFVAPALTMVLATLAKFAIERRIFAQAVDGETPAQTPLNKTARLLAGELNPFFRARIAFGLAGGVVLPVAIWLQPDQSRMGFAALAIASLLLCTVGEGLERFLFFTAMVPQKMPRGVTA